LTLSFSSKHREEYRTDSGSALLQLGNLIARTFAESGSNAVVILDLDQKMAEQAADDLVKWFVEHGQAKEGEISAIGLVATSQTKRAFKTASRLLSTSMVVLMFSSTLLVSSVSSASLYVVTIQRAYFAFSCFRVENYPASEYPAEKFRKLMAINVEGWVKQAFLVVSVRAQLIPFVSLSSFYTAREAAKDMMRRDAPGSIVLIGSMSGAAVNIPQPQSPYNASKAG